MPEEILSALADESVTKWAFNASFERICPSNWLKRSHPEYFLGYSIPEDPAGQYLNPESWKCTMIWSAYMGLPLSLEGVGAVLKLQNQKLKEGKDLIRYFCTPCKPTKSNGGRTRNLPLHDSEKWMRFKEYNLRDVEVEMAIKKRLAKYPVPDFIWDEYHLDQEINDRGIALDMNVVRNAISFDGRSRETLTASMQAITGLENSNSVQQMKEWLANHGVEANALDKKAVKELIRNSDNQTVQTALMLREEISGNAERSLQGRQGSRHVPVLRCQPFRQMGRSANPAAEPPQNHLPDLELARQYVMDGDYEMLELLFDSVPAVLSELIRTAFIPRPGYKFIVSDFSAIEARVLAFLAGETWRSKVFTKVKDIYCASASQMFGVPVEKHGINSHLRQKGKIAELALGYGGSVGALKSMGALDMGLSEEELQPLVNSWRASNPMITAFWWDVDRAVKTTITQRIPTEVRSIRFFYKSGMLFIQLPSGRRLSYVKPRIGINQFGGESVTYEGVSATKKWELIESYGPKFVENIVQAISRDILCNAMKTLRHCFIVGHVHDELIIECSSGVDLKAVCNQMGHSPDWMPDILLQADGYETDYYKKD